MSPSARFSAAQTFGSLPSRAATASEAGHGPRPGGLVEDRPDQRRQGAVLVAPGMAEAVT